MRKTAGIVLIVLAVLVVVAGLGGCVVAGNDDGDWIGEGYLWLGLVIGAVLCGIGTWIIREPTPSPAPVSSTGGGVRQSPKPSARIERIKDMFAICYPCQQKKYGGETLGEIISKRNPTNEDIFLVLILVKGGLLCEECVKNYYRWYNG